MTKEAKEALVIGGGAREHALVWGLKESGAKVYASPGNAGIGRDAELVSASSPEDLQTFFGARRPLVVVGPEVPLANGWADQLRAQGFPVVGPSARAARLESSKRLAKQVMRQYGIPTAESRTAYSPEKLAGLIRECVHWPMVMKQSGLAQGKGVVIVEDAGMADRVVNQWSAQDVWQDGVLFEEFLEGYEVSVQVVTNGHAYVWLPVSRDYKRLTPSTASPNTGGMGAVAPVPLDPGLVDAIDRLVLQPVMTYLTEEALFYRGVLYAGLMITNRGIRVLEFNVRLGDPESQAILPLLQVDWWEFWYQVSQGQLPKVARPTQHAVAVVMAAEGYPGNPVRGMAIDLGNDLPDTRIFHAGTSGDDPLISQGGRVLTVTGWGASSMEARRKAYRRIDHIRFPRSYFRLDIGE